jgi:hypothetical protein
MGVAEWFRWFYLDARLLERVLLEVDFLDPSL